ncbi:hypothetical protein [Providencia rettgeri]|uniref:hypothetical protein n=1 Tax=Providencia rettgeri TaxID=587 RepID=UPI0018E44DE4|nr:hypothetical protein [Providencia rettgeri]MBI6201725.1 hypothetical protein [Providencia rettgeri]
MSKDIHADSRAAAFKTHYIKAIEVVEGNGYYWFSAPRPVADALNGLIQEYGIETIMSSHPPVWDFVICKRYLHNDGEKFQRLARIRFELKEKGTADDLLPTNPTF